jgi:hypothetical protein
LNKPNLHPYRLKVKELRNVLQMADNADQQEFITRLGEVKDAIVCAGPVRKPAAPAALATYTCQTRLAGHGRASSVKQSN